jgi:hypothetical protein
MTPKEKAEKLVSDFYTINSKLIKVKNGYDMGDRYNLVMPISKQCALIAVDEILNLNLGLSNCDENNWETDKFYNEVKQEIEKL